MLRKKKGFELLDTGSKLQPEDNHLKIACGSQLEAHIINHYSLTILIKIMNYWLVKSEPSVYSWDEFVKEGQTFWSGIRNYAARLHLRAMKKGDLVLFYHSNEGLCIVGVAKVIKEAYQDPSTTEDWSAVDLKPFKKLKTPVTLQQLKADARFKDMALIRIGRLSVSPVKAEEFHAIMELGRSL